MMPKVKATKPSKIQFVLQGFFEGMMISPINELYYNLCSSTVSCNKCFLVESHRHMMSKHKKSVRQQV